MGRKIRAASLTKISKKNPKHHREKKQQLNSLIQEAVRPKVYITNSSSFKSLVQQLTGLHGGNANYTAAIDHISSSSSPPSPPPPPQTQLDHHHHHPDESNSMETTSSDHQYASFDYLNQYSAYDHQILCYQLDDHETISECLLMNQQQVEEEEGFCVESWLVNMEAAAAAAACPNVSGIQQEVSIYDYELNGLI